MSNKQLFVFISSIGIFIILSFGGVIWYDSLAPIDKCWSEKCRFHEQMIIYDLQIKRAEESANQSAEAYRRGEQKLHDFDAEMSRVIRNGPETK